MFDKFFKSEFEEIKKNKVRVIGLALCLIFALCFSVWNYFDTGEEIILSETVEETLPEKNSVVQKVSEENIIPVIGANSEILFVKNPFAIKKVEQVEEKKITPPNVEEKISPPNVEEKIFPPPETKKSESVEEKFVLVGTAIAAQEKTALVRHTIKSKSEDLFLNIGDLIGGKKILDITENFILLEGGEKLYLNLQ